MNSPSDGRNVTMPAMKHSIAIEMSRNVKPSKLPMAQRHLGGAIQTQTYSRNTTCNIPSMSAVNKYDTHSEEQTNSMSIHTAQHPLTAETFSKPTTLNSMTADSQGSCRTKAELKQKYLSDNNFNDTELQDSNVDDPLLVTPSNSDKQFVMSPLGPVASSIYEELEEVCYSTRKYDDRSSSESDRSRCSSSNAVNKPGNLRPSCGIRMAEIRAVKKHTNGQTIAVNQTQDRIKCDYSRHNQVSRLDHYKLCSQSSCSLSNSSREQINKVHNGRNILKSNLTALSTSKLYDNTRGDLSVHDHTVVKEKTNLSSDLKTPLVKTDQLRSVIKPTLKDKSFQFKQNKITQDKDLDNNVSKKLLNKGTKVYSSALEIPVTRQSEILTMQLEERLQPILVNPEHIFNNVRTSQNSCDTLLQSTSSINSDISEEYLTESSVKTDSEWSLKSSSLSSEFNSVETLLDNVLSLSETSLTCKPKSHSFNDDLHNTVFQKNVISLTDNARENACISNVCTPHIVSDIQFTSSGSLMHSNLHQPIQRIHNFGGNEDDEESLLEISDPKTNTEKK